MYECGLTMPHTHGFMIMWTEQRLMVNRITGLPVLKPVKQMYQNESRDAVEAKKQELERAGLTVENIRECIF